MGVQSMFLLVTVGNNEVKHLGTFPTLEHAKALWKEGQQIFDLKGKEYKPQPKTWEIHKDGKYLDTLGNPETVEYFIRGILNIHFKSAWNPNIPYHPLNYTIKPIGWRFEACSC
jgi:hypothetical protein